jgi:hypothetical protein
MIVAIWGGKMWNETQRKMYNLPLAIPGRGGDNHAE